MSRGGRWAGATVPSVGALKTAAEIPLQTAQHTFIYRHTLEVTGDVAHWTIFRPACCLLPVPSVLLLAWWC